MWTSYFSGNLEIEKVLELCTKVCNIPNNQCSIIILVYSWFFCTPQQGIQFFLHDICHFFVCIADGQSSRNLKPTLFQIFQVFLTTGIFAFYTSTTIVWIQFFYFLFSCYFFYIKGSLNITAHLSMKIILVDPSLVRTFLVIVFLILIMVPTLKYNCAQWCTIKFCAH